MDRLNYLASPYCALGLDLGTEEEERDIVHELRMLQRVGSHPNIVSLIGSSLYDGRLYFLIDLFLIMSLFFPSKGHLLVIVEYCPGGNLLEYLRRSRQATVPLSLKQQLHMCLQVSRGMEHLADKMVLQCTHVYIIASPLIITPTLSVCSS